MAVAAYSPSLLEGEGREGGWRRMDPAATRRADLSLQGEGDRS